MSLLLLPPPTETLLPSSTFTETPTETATLLPTATETPTLSPFPTLGEGSPTETPVLIPSPSPTLGEGSITQTATLTPTSWVTETASATSTVVLKSTDAEALSDTLPTFDLVTDEIFETSDLSGWTLGNGWSRVQTELGGALESTLADQEAIFAPVPDNLSVQIRTRWDSGSISLHLDGSGTDEYRVTLHANRDVTLLRNGVQVVSATAGPLPSTLYQTMTLRVWQGVVGLSVDGNLMFEYTDEQPLNVAQLALSATGMTRAQFDWVRVWALSETMFAPAMSLSSVFITPAPIGYYDSYPIAVEAASPSGQFSDPPAVLGPDVSTRTLIEANAASVACLIVRFPAQINPQTGATIEVFRSAFSTSVGNPR